MKKVRSFIALGLLLCVAFSCRTLSNLATQNLFEGSNMEKAAAAFKQKLGGQAAALKLEITRDQAVLHVRESGDPDKVDQYVFSRNRCVGPQPVKLDGMEQLMNQDKYVFTVDEVNFGAISNVIANALDRTKLEGGQVTRITIKKNLLQGVKDNPNALTLTWKIDIQGTRESASALASAAGEILSVDLSQTSRAAKTNYLESQTFQSAMSDVQQLFGNKIYFAEIYINRSNITFVAGTSPETDTLHRYQYTINGVSIADVDNEALGLSAKHKFHEYFFTPNEIDLGKMAEIEGLAFEKSGNNKFIDSITLKRGEYRITPQEFVRGVVLKLGPVEWEVSVREYNAPLGAFSENLFFDNHGNLMSDKYGYFDRGK